MKSKLLNLPSNLDITTLISNDKTLTDKQKASGIKYTQRVLYPVSKILTDYKLNKTFKNEKEEDIFVMINSTILKSIITNSFAWVIPFLLRNNVIVKCKNIFLMSIPDLIKSVMTILILNLLYNI